MASDDRDNEEPTSLLTQIEDWDSLPEGPAGEWQPGQRLGPFVLKKELGSGGMGMVWLAEQQVPLRRDVALKVMLPEKRSKLAEAQFEVERQALAQLSHRNIAQIYDAGELPDGGLFFAMEYVPGQRLDHYLEQQPLTLKSLIALMVEICAGMQHAHQHGLVHRDIKPHNILVSEFEGRPEPKIIDFGVVVGNADGTRSDRERYFHAGTRAYMAPEQHERKAVAIDVRADVYGLGAVLAHGLLIHAGARLEGEQGFFSTQAHEALNRSLGENDADGAEDSPELADRLKKLPAELRAIASKAMAHQREDRYQSATALAEDLQRWLNSEPVHAVGHSRAYRMRCFLRRNALASTAAGLISLAVIGGMVTALYGLTEAREGRSQAESALALAEQRRMEAEELIQFMLGDFAEQLRPIGRLDLLDSIGSEALRYLTAQGAGDNPHSALSRARALRTLGEVQVRRQQFDHATDTLARAAGLLHPWHERQDSELAELHFESGQIAFWRGLVAYRQRHWETTETHWQQYMHHARLFAELTDDVQRGRTEKVYALNNLGTLAEARNQLEDASSYFRQTIGMRRDLLEENDIQSIVNLANALSWSARVESALGQTIEAWQRNSEALELLEAAHGFAPEHARRRSLEINFRFILARDAYNLGFEDHARYQLQNALPLAEADVGNEPGQPRRQAMLARIAFMLATLTDPDSEAAAALIERGERALATALDLGLDPLRAIEVPAESLQARLHGNQYTPDEKDLSALEAVLQALQGREEFDAHFFNLMEVATSVAWKLTHHGTDMPAHWLETLKTQLVAVPPEQQNSLRYKVIRYRLGRLRNPDDPELLELEERLGHLRELVAVHINDSDV